MNNCQNSCRISTCRRNCLYAWVALGFLALVLLFAIGVIVGVVNAEPLLTVLPAVVAFAAAIAAIIIAIVIYWIVCRNQH